ncbi:MAG: hypothetical protein ACREEM_08920 [Blastocatellia bacterium]
MSTRLFFLLILSTTFAVGSNLVRAQAQIPSAGNKLTLSGEIEDNNGKFRLYLTNDSDREFRGRVIIGLGSGAEQQEIGQISLTLPPLEGRLLQFATASRTGSHYSLRMLDWNDAPVFFKIAPIKTASDATPATEVTLAPVSKLHAEGGGLLVDSTPSPTAGADKPRAAGAEVTIQTRLLGGDSEADPFRIAFEITPLRPINEARLSITMGKHNDHKAVTANRPITIEFKLPDTPDAEQISYVLVARDGREIARGEIKLDQLMAEDYVNVSDIRTDRPGYDFGATAKVTVVLEGKSPHGYRLEVLLRDSAGSVLFTDQRQSKADKHEATQEFTIVLPRNGETPLTFEFKIYDGETGLLFDSGEREIPVNKADRSL